MRRRWAILLLGLALVGCASEPPVPSAEPARRIVSLVPSFTEILFSLGAGDRVVAVTENDTFPPEAARLPRVGDLQPDYERILALRPDLVVGDPGLQGPQLERLRHLGVPVLSLESQSLEGLRQALGELGRATGTTERATALQQAMEAQIRSHQAHRRPAPPRVFVEIWDKPLMTCGAGTYVHELVTLAGGQNLYADLSGHPAVSSEDLVRRQPDLIVLTIGTPEEAARRPGWSSLRAVQKGRIHRIDPDLLVRPTPRFPQALDLLSGWFFP
ncbi:MAG: cobalamin-binding protein [Candidatus Eremiobacterota bacterium]